MPSPPTSPTVPSSYPAPCITLTNRAINKQLSIVPTLPTEDTPEGEYGEVVTFDFSAPEDTLTINIQWIPDASIAAYVTMCKTPGSVLSITDDAGIVWQGKISGFAQKRFKGTNLNEIDIVLKKI